MPATLRARSALVLPFLLAALLAVSLFAVAPSADAATRHKKVKNAVDVVRAQKGDPYRWGAAGPHAFDCSGLTYFAFRKAGFKNIPRTSGQQARFARRIKKSNMRRGDLMFFRNSSGKVYHVGVFAGWKDGRRYILHAPSTGKRVHRAKVWTHRWTAGTLR